MTIIEVYRQMTGGELAGWALMMLILFLSLIQISPIKLNPWDATFAWIGGKMTGGIRSQLTDLKKHVKDIWINNHRHGILTFARECRSGIDHSTEEWTYILNLCGEYEEYCSKNGVMNGVVRENMKYIRDLFHELSREQKI